MWKTALKECEGVSCAFKFFKGFLRQILLGPFLNTLTQIDFQTFLNFWHFPEQLLWYLSWLYTTSFQRCMYDLSKIYDGRFFAEKINEFFIKKTVVDVCQGPKHASDLCQSHVKPMLAEYFISLPPEDVKKPKGFFRGYRNGTLDENGFRE